MLRAPARFDPARDEARSAGGAEEQPAAQRAMWRACWKAMDLSDVPGWPLWEKQVYEALRPHFMSVLAVYVHYARRGAGFDASQGAKSLDAAEWGALALPETRASTGAVVLMLALEHPSPSTT